MAWSIFSSGGGTNPKSWADAFLAAIGAPNTPANEQSVIAWMIQEGGGGQNNPLNTTEGGFGATGSINSAGVKNYPTLGDGVNATAKTLENGSYPNILSDLRSGKGISANASGNLQTWGTGSFATSISQHWSQAAGFLSGKSSPIPTGGNNNAGGGGGGINPLNDIVPFFTDAWKFFAGTDPNDSTKGRTGPPWGGIMWLIDPGHWMRIAAFLAGVALLGFALIAFYRASQGQPVIDATGTIPIPIPIG